MGRRVKQHIFAKKKQNGTRKSDGGEKVLAGIMTHYRKSEKY